MLAGVTSAILPKAHTSSIIDYTVKTGAMQDAVGALLRVLRKAPLHRRRPYTGPAMSFRGFLHKTSPHHAACDMLLNTAYSLLRRSAKRG